MNGTAPEIVLNCSRVIAYALVDNSVTYTERGSFFVDLKLLGAVPKLAICQDTTEEEIMVFHCDHEWNVLGASGGHKSVDEAKKCIERSYSGLMERWVETGTTKEEAIAYLDQVFADEKCSFCGKWPLYVEQMIGNEVRICNYCIDKFYKLVHEPNGTA